MDVISYPRLKSRAPRLFYEVAINVILQFVKWFRNKRNLVYLTDKVNFVKQCIMIYIL